MFEKLNIWCIIRDHFLTLRSGENILKEDTKLSKVDLFLFVLFPLILATLLFLFGVRLSNDNVNSMLTIFSIFTALLFNLLLLVFDITQNNYKNDRLSPRDKILKIVLKNIFSNISFLILNSIVLLIFLLLLIFNFEIVPAFETIENFLRGFAYITIYSLSINFILTLIMILKRIHLLLNKQFSNSQ